MKKIKYKLKAAAPEPASKTDAALSRLAEKLEAKQQDRKNVPAVLSLDGDDLWSLWDHGVTQGFLATFMTCREKANLSYLKGLRRSDDSGPVGFGNAIHWIQEQFYAAMQRKVQNGGFTADPTVFAEAQHRILFDQYEKEKRHYIINDTELSFDNDAAFAELESTLGSAEPLWFHYIHYWKDDFTEVDWVELEGTFEVPWTLPDGRVILLRGKIDGLRRSKKTGRLWLFETKTKGRIQEDLIMELLGFDMQVMLYSYAVFVKYGEWPEGVVYNILRRPQLKQKQKETYREFAKRIAEDIATRPDFYFMRFHSTLEHSQLERWKEELGRVLVDVVQWYESRDHYRNSAACSGIYPCPFLRYCSQGSLHGLYRRDQPFPELVEAEVVE